MGDLADLVAHRADGLYRGNLAVFAESTFALPLAAVLQGLPRGVVKRTRRGGRCTPGAGQKARIARQIAQRFQCAGFSGLHAALGIGMTDHVGNAFEHPRRQAPGRLHRRGTVMSRATPSPDGLTLGIEQSGF